MNERFGGQTKAQLRWLASAAADVADDLDLLEEYGIRTHDELSEMMQTRYHARLAAQRSYGTDTDLDADDLDATADPYMAEILGRLVDHQERPARQLTKVSYPGDDVPADIRARQHEEYLAERRAAIIVSLVDHPGGALQHWRRLRATAALTGAGRRWVRDTARADMRMVRAMSLESVERRPREYLRRLNESDADAVARFDEYLAYCYDEDAAKWDYYDVPLHIG